jgi:hypothetical protein
MNSKKIIAYGILLPVLAATALLFGTGIGDTQARYVTVAGWHTQVYEPADAVYSNILEQGGQTVLLGQLDPAEEYTTQMWVASVGANTTGKLVCEPVENGEYVTVSFPEQLTLVDGVPQEFTLTLNPTALAQDIRRETVTVKLRMYWQQDPALEAILELDLLPVGTEQQPNVPEAGSDKRDLSTYVTFMENYAPGSLLSVRCNIPQDSTSWRLGLLDGDSREKPFPAMTRYSLDGGRNYYILAQEGEISLPVDTEAAVDVLLDFSRADISQIINNGIINLHVSGSADSWTGTSVCSVNAELSLPGDSENTAVAVVTQHRSLQLQIPRMWDGTQLEYTITRQGKQSSAPMPSVAVGDGVLTVSAEDGLPKPGTYILTLTWKYGEVEIANRRIVLFVNYSAYADAAIITEGGNAV